MTLREPIDFVSLPGEFHCRAAFVGGQVNLIAMVVGLLIFFVFSMMPTSTTCGRGDEDCFMMRPDPFHRLVGEVLVDG